MPSDLSIQLTHDDYLVVQFIIELKYSIKSLAYKKRDRMRMFSV